MIFWSQLSNFHISHKNQNGQKSNNYHISHNIHISIFGHIGHNIFCIRITMFTSVIFVTLVTIFILVKIVTLVNMDIVVTMATLVTKFTSNCSHNGQFCHNSHISNLLEKLAHFARTFVIMRLFLKILKQCTKEASKIRFYNAFDNDYS